MTIRTQEIGDIYTDARGTKRAHVQIETYKGSRWGTVVDASGYDLRHKEDRRDLLVAAKSKIERENDLFLM